jgi:hypothetical protein
MIGKSHEYSLEQSGKLVKDAGVPAGPLITEDTAMTEMIYFVSAIVNRMGASNSGNRVSTIASGNGMVGFKKGLTMLENGSLPHRQVAFARAAIDWVHEHGSALPENVQYWKAVRQGNSVRPWRDGIDYKRVGMTDFSTKN